MIENRYLFRLGMTVPLGRDATAQREAVLQLADLGYEDLWSSETNAHDAFTPLAQASVWAPQLRLGTAIASVFTRGRATLAQTAAAMAQAAPGRFVLGLGASSDVIVERWNDLEFRDPYKRVRDTLRFVRAALAGEKTDGGFWLGLEVPTEVPILVAGLREGMLRLGGREGDGVILNWLSADDVATAASVVAKAAADAGRPTPEVCVRVFVVASEDRKSVVEQGRRMVAAYLTVPVYRAQQEWLGRGEALTEMWRLWDAGNRAAAVAAVPESVIDELVVHGSPEGCREQLAYYGVAGATTVAVAPLPFGVRPLDTAQAVAPR